LTVGVIVSMGVAGTWTMGGQNGGHRADAGEGEDGPFAFETQRFFGAAFVGRDLEGEADVAVFDSETLDHASANHVIPAVAHSP
jgi:hypothetical protein